MLGLRVMRALIFLLSVVVLVVLAGCVETRVSYMPMEPAMVGKESTWPSVPVDRDHGLPIYRREPPKQEYMMTGVILAMKPSMGTESPDRAAVRVAKKHGADALIQFDGGREFVGTTTSSWGSANAYGRQYGTFSPDYLGNYNYSGYGSGTAYGSSFSTTRPQYAYWAKYFAIKFLYPVTGNYFDRFDG